MIPLVIESGETATEIEIRDLISSKGCHECTLQHSLKILWENFRYSTCTDCVLNLMSCMGRMSEMTLVVLLSEQMVGCLVC